MADPIPPDIEQSEGELVETRYDIVKDDWCEYQLEDGTLLRMRFLLTGVQRMVDSNGNTIIAEDGQPQVSLNGSVSIVFQSPQEGLG